MVTVKVERDGAHAMLIHGESMSDHASIVLHIPGVYEAPLDNPIILRPGEKLVISCEPL